ncbi:MAG TPA: hypothetical protein VFT78_06400 [Hanamia sp.]|nr:hypothetical protein [Hanamia sp.]
MKTRTIILGSFLAATFILVSARHSTAQIGKKIKNEVKFRVENSIIQKSGDATYKAFDKTVNGISKVANNSTADRGDLLKTHTISCI